MKHIKPHEWLGIPASFPERLSLKAGDLSAVLSHGRLLDISFQGKTMLDEAYFALRDSNWGTIPYVITSQHVSEQEVAFEVQFEAEYQQGIFHYHWSGHIVGSADGALRYEVRGEALSRFLTNRLGICALHAHTCAGLACDISHTDGTVEHTCFPSLIAPNQPFTDISGMAYEIEGVRCEISFEGESFECEDQRNWTDASFKTYCPPLHLPFPVQIIEGQQLFQAVALRCQREKASVALPRETIDNLDYTALSHRLFSFSLGSCLTTPLEGKALSMASKLGLHHVQVNLRFQEKETLSDTLLHQAAQIASVIHLSVFLTENWAAEVEVLQGLLQKHDKIKVLMLHQEGQKVIGIDLLRECRHRLSRRGLKIGSGTDAFFTQLNREPLPRELLDFVCYSNNPQVHAFDNHSVMQTIYGQAANVISGKSLYPGLPVHVTPLTLKIRWNPDATNDNSSPDERLLKQVDKRQMSLFCGTWLLRSIISLAQSGAASATYFEISGPRGLFSDEQPAPKGFPVVPGMLYPAWFVMRQATRILSSPRVRMLNGPRFSVMVDDENMLLANSSFEPLNLSLRRWPDFRGGILEEKTVEDYSFNQTLKSLMYESQADNIDTKRMKLNIYSIFIGHIS